MVQVVGADNAAVHSRTMIVRQHADRCLVLSDPDLATVATTLAEHFGNPRFDPPGRSVLRGIARLGAGLADLDRVVRVGPDGRPVDREQAALSDLLAAWTRATHADDADDPEALLLTSFVVLRLAADAGISPPGHPPLSANAQNRLRFETNKFVHAQVELQEGLRRRLGLATDRPLRLGIAETMDDPAELALSLHLRLMQCLWNMAECLARGRSGGTTPVFSAASGDFDAIGVRMLASDRCLIVPWCFAPDRFEFELPFREWPTRDHRDVPYADLPRAGWTIRLAPHP